MSSRPYSVKTFGFRGSWGQIHRLEEGFRRIGCRIAAEGDDFDFIYSNELLQDRAAIACKERTGRPLIRHIHDLPALEDTPMQRRAEELQTHRQTVLDSADIVTANTQFVADQLEEYWGYRGAAVTGQPIQFESDLTDFRDRRRRNLVAVIGRLDDPMKNVDLVLRALSRLRAPPDLAMVSVGKVKRNLRPSLFFLRRFGIERHRELSPDGLAALLKEARMLLCPSLFEGLGLPPIEALSVGTPAIVSDIPVKREVFAGIPMLFHDPLDAKDLARAIQFLLDHEDAGWAMVTGFAPKIDAYRPETIARKIVDLYSGLERS